MFDLHRHTEFSLFDGHGKAENLAKVAKENGLTALGISDHGTVSGLIQHYFACKDEGIKPILGCECYYQKEFDQDAKSYHLCLFAKNVQGYRNLNKIVTIANKDSFYYHARVTWDLLEQYHEGLICSTACIASIFGQRIANGNVDAAKTELKRFKGLFGNDFYIEIQPYSIDTETTQQSVNEVLLDLAGKLNIPCILTSDSHYGKKDEIDTIVKMHQIAKHEGIDIVQTYGERYMPTYEQLEKRFVKTYRPGKDITEQEYKGKLRWLSYFKKCAKEFEAKIDDDILDNLGDTTPRYGVDDAYKMLCKLVKSGMKERGCTTDKYIERVKKELAVIRANDFSDYFLIVQDYVNWAKKQGIKVGPGRGSVCNCVIAYFLGITEVDSLYFDLDYRRFLRKDKKKYPDVDLDFETDRRQEVIDYIVTKYAGKAAQICSYGLYKVDNALNDLFKVCGVDAKSDQQEIKTYVHSQIGDDEVFDYDAIKNDRFVKDTNNQFDNILLHFSRLYKKVRYIGTHAAGVALVGSDITDFVAVERRGGKFSCAYDLDDLDKLHILKFDILGLITMSEIRELEEYTHKKYSPEWLNDSEVYEHFRAGDTDGIFQFESSTVKNMLNQIDCDCFEDLCAANAMNRPAPLQLKMPDTYADNKKNLAHAKKSLYYRQTKKTYGTVIYQEQIMRICREIGKLSWDDADKMMKMIKGADSRAAFLRGENPDCERMRKDFIKGAVENGFDKKVAADTFNSMLVYSFNKGHCTGYSMIALIEMWYKIYYPEHFWLVKLKYCNKLDLPKYKGLAVRSGCVILLPHVNGSAEYSVSNKFGSQCLQEGLCNIDFVGLKAAQAIEEERLKHGDYESFPDFRSRLPRRIVTARVLNALENAGALEFNERRYLIRTEKYNSSIYGRGR